MICMGMPVEFMSTLFDKSIKKRLPENRWPVQVNLFQKPSFLHKLTHNMTRDCSLSSPKNTSSQQLVYKNCFFLFLFWHSKQYLYTTCCQLVFFLEFNEQSLVILWVNWWKNEGFWKRFTCKKFYVSALCFWWFLLITKDI